jgi:hypothetical protein
MRDIQGRQMAAKWFNLESKWQRRARPGDATASPAVRGRHRQHFYR